MGFDFGKIADIKLTVGTLEDTPLALLFGAIRSWRATGVLSLEKSKSVREIYFLQGLPVFCKAESNAESLRQVMHKAGKIDRNTLTIIEKKMQVSFKPEDQVMIEMGVIDEGTRYFHLQEQARKRILSCFEWNGGYYLFKATESFLDKIELFDLDPLEVIYEGLKIHPVDMAKSLKQVGKEKVFAAEDATETLPFISKYFPGAQIDFNEIQGWQLKMLLPTFHEDDKLAIELTFILIAIGALKINGKKPAENNPPPEPVDETPPPLDETVECAGWRDDVEQPDLQKDFAIPHREKSAEATSENAPQKNKEKTPSLPAWKLKQLEHKKKISESMRRTPSISLQSKPIRADLTPPPTTVRAENRKIDATPPPQQAPSQSGESDNVLIKRFLKMVEAIRGGNWFDVLDANEDMSKQDLKKAYFYRHSQFHPDRKNALGPEGDKIVEEIQNGLKTAYDTLLDPDERQQYQMKYFSEEYKKAWSIELKQDLARKQFHRGLWYMALRRPDLAFSFFDSAVNLDARHSNYYAFLGWSQYASRKTRIDESKAFLNTALEINPRLSEAHLFLGWIFKDAGNEKAAHDSFSKALEYNQHNTFAKQELDRMSTKKTGDKSTGFMKKLFNK